MGSMTAATRRTLLVVVKIKGAENKASELNKQTKTSLSAKTVNNYKTVG
jgi:hypothetical protein